MTHPPPQVEEAGGFRLRSVALPAYGPTVVEAMGYGASIPLLALVARDLGASVALAAFIGSVLGLGQLVTSLPAGAVIARVGERRAMVAASGVGAAAAVLTWAAPNLLILAVASVATGMTWTVFLLARQGFMIDAVPWGMRGRALSTLGGTHRIGMFLGPVLAAPLIAAYGARSAFLFAAAMSGLALLLVLRVPDLGGAARAEARADPASMRQVLHAHRRALLTLGVGALGISALRGVRLTIIPLWADHLGLSPANVALIVGLGALLEILVFYPAGALMDRAGRVWVAVPTALLLGIGLLLIPSTGSLRALLLASLVMALGNGLGSGIVMTLGADTAPRVHRAKYLGGWRLVADLGATGGPLLVSGVTLVAGLATASVVVGAGGVLVAGWLAQWVGALDRARRGPGRPVDERMRE